MIDVTEQDFQQQVIERSQDDARRRRLLGGVVRPVPRARPGRSRRRPPRARARSSWPSSTPTPTRRSRRPSGSSASRPSRRSRTAGSSTSSSARCRPRRSSAFFDGLVPTEADGAGRGRRRGVAAPRDRARARPRRRRASRWRSSSAGSGDVDGALATLGQRAGRLQRRRPRRAHPPGARATSPALDDAFRALDGGDPENGRRPADRGDRAGQRRTRTTCAASIVGILDAFGVDHPLRARRAPAPGRRAVLDRARRAPRGRARGAARRCGSGRSHQNMCPTPSRISRRAPGISAAISLPLSTGSIASSSPWTPASAGPRAGARRALRVVAGDRLHLEHDHRDRRGQRLGHRPERLVVAVGSRANACETLTSKPLRIASSRSPLIIPALSLSIVACGASEEPGPPQ